jgi:glyoxylase-like metal-dependent hydrolase (beta-lactamase superfamily II)
MSNKDRKTPEACVTMGWCECAPGIYEIDEFDCASCFLVVGEEKALLIDTGVGIGDLRWLVENELTDKPYEVVATHQHGDHIGGAGWFDDIWIHPADANWKGDHTEPTLEFRRNYAALIRRREGKQYDYDPDTDIRPWPKEPTFRAARDGQRFELGGRTVTAYHCPGHTPGELVLVDSLTKTLLCGDACNCNWLLNGRLAPTLRGCVEVALEALRRVTAMQGDAYDAEKVYNFHHDFRPVGKPLAPNVLPDLVACLESLLNGTARFERTTDPLSPTGGDRSVARYGDVMVSCMNGDLEKEMSKA